MDPLIIRPINENELPALEWEGQYIHYRNIYRQTYVEMCVGRRIILVASRQDTILGQILIRFNTIPADPEPDHKTGYFYSFRVLPQFRDQGIGSSLLLEAEATLLNRKFNRALICAVRDNHAVIRLYERNGYRRLCADAGDWSFQDHQGKTRHVHEPAWIMEKKLS